MKYTQKEIREAHERVSKDLENAYSTEKGIALAIECQDLVLTYLKSIMTEEEKKPEEEKKEEEKEETTQEEQAKE